MPYVRTREVVSVSNFAFTFNMTWWNTHAVSPRFPSQRASRVFFAARLAGSAPRYAPDGRARGGDQGARARRNPANLGPGRVEKTITARSWVRQQLTSRRFDAPSSLLFSHDERRRCVSRVSTWYSRTSPAHRARGLHRRSTPTTRGTHSHQPPSASFRVRGDSFPVPRDHTHPPRVAPTRRESPRVLVSGFRRKRRSASSSRDTHPRTQSRHRTHP